MSLPDYIKPGANVVLKDGTKARIYATDGAEGNTIHGAYFAPDLGWCLCRWNSNHLALLYPLFHGDGHSIAGPWVEPRVDVTGFWEKMPAWMHWAAQDANGVWFLFAVEPELCPNDGVWTGRNPCVRGVLPHLQIPDSHVPPFTGDWKDSLIQRPEK